MKSMTGYGESLSKIHGAEISVVIKSVNGRFLDSRFHLPKEYLHFETQLKKNISKLFRRGTVDIFVQRRGESKIKINFNKDIANKWVQGYRALSRSLRLPLSSQTLMEKLTEHTQIFDIREADKINGAEKKVFFSVFSEALRHCDKERIREGKSIKLHIEKVLQKLAQIVNRMNKLRADANAGISEKLKERFQRTSFASDIEPSRFAQELLFYLDKSDISEEVERLKEHVHMCTTYLRSNEAQGKKLDFYSQELLREVNTIGSKANYAPLTELVVEAKSLIEIFKEQVQNVE